MRISDWSSDVCFSDLLDVVGQILARGLRGDRRLHRAQAVERAEVEVAAVDEGPQRDQEIFALGDVTGHRARLLPGVALPVAALALEILQIGRASGRERVCQYV